MTKKEIIEKVAELIYLNEGGVSPEEFKKVCGFSKRKWKTGRKWDSYDDELCEWERDEYRHQATVIVNFIEQENLFRVGDKKE
jgi:hypothetical protein